MRYSKQRELILNTVLDNPVHLTAENVYEMLKAEHSELSLGTVYRNLNVLVENKVLRKISVPNGSDRFDGTPAVHQHIVCRKCGKVMDVYIPELEDICERVRGKTGFRVDCSSLAFEGLCDECCGEDVSD